MGGATHAELRDQHEPGGQGTCDGTQRVDAVQQGNATSKVLVGLNRCGGEERQRGPHQGSGQQQHQDRGKESAGRQQHESASTEVVGQAIDDGEISEHAGQQEPTDGDAQLEPRVDQERVGERVTAPAGETRAQGQPAHVGDDHGAQRVGSRAEDVAEHAGPRDLVYQPGGPRREKDEVDDRKARG